MFTTLILSLLQGFSSKETWLSFSFHLTQLLSNFFKYSSSNFLSSYPNKIFAIYFPGNSLLLNYSVFGFNFTLYLFSIPSCLLTSVFLLPSNLSTNSLVFSKFSSFSHVSFSAVNPFYLTKYFITFLTFYLIKIFSIFHSLTSSTSTGFGSSTLCSFISFLYHSILLTFTTRWILIEAGSFNFTAFFDTTSSTSYGFTYISVNFFTGLSLNTKSFVLNITLSPFFQFSTFLYLLSAYLFMSSCIFLRATTAFSCTFFILFTNSVTFSTFLFLLISAPILESLP